MNIKKICRQQRNKAKLGNERLLRKAKKSKFAV